MKERVCPECGAAFMPRYGTQVCCGDKCRARRKHRASAESAAQFRERARKAAAAKRKEKARRRAEFFAARDAAFDRAGLPIPKIEVRGRVKVERRGNCPVAPWTHNPLEGR